MTAVAYTPLLASLNKRQYPVTQDQLNSLVLSTGVVTFSSLTQALAPYLLTSSLGGSLAPYVLTSTLVATLATYAALSGTNVFTGKEQFKDMPWADVMAYGATGNGSTDDTAAIQAAIDHMNGVYVGGFVFIPPGNYVTSSLGLTVKGGVILMGSGQKVSFINGTNHDATVLHFDGSCAYAGIRDVIVGGYLNSLAINNAVNVANGVVVNMRDSEIVGGAYAIGQGGVDGRIFNVFAMGYQGAVFTTGGNFYTDCKFDDPGGFNPVCAMNFSSYYAGSVVVEDQVTTTDMSGNQTSIIINDPAQKRRIKFIGCIISGGISVLNHGWTLLNGCELGVENKYTLTSTNPVTFVGCYQQGSGNVTLAGANVIKAGNFQIV